MTCTKRLAFLTFGGMIPGGPGSVKDSAFLRKAAANWSIRWLDSSIASDDKLSNVTKSTIGKEKRENTFFSLTYGNGLYYYATALTVVV